jgi:hypothetical protein
VTLKECDEEECRAGKGRNEHGSVNNPGVYTLDGNAKQEATNGDLRQDHRAAIEEIAVEPALSRFLHLPFFEILVVATCTVVCSYCRGTTVANEENLRVISDGEQAFRLV